VNNYKEDFNKDNFPTLGDGGKPQQKQTVGSSLLKTLNSQETKVDNKKVEKF